jgi:Tol biopolymer transport system component
MPTWSPTGEQIAFTNADHLYVVRPDGSDLRQITDSPCTGRQDPCRRDFGPDWSHDGARILFTDGAVLLSVRPDGSGLERLTDPAEPLYPGAPPALISDPHWSPDDDAVVFERGERVEVLDGGSLVALRVDANPLVTLTANRTDGNADLGIEAADGVVDGGGNRARRNGDPRQCVNVGCSREFG